MSHLILEGLNEQQREAVTTVEGPVLVLAGPGSGKTRVLTHRIAYLLDVHRVFPSHIMASTFTNKAANEMRERINGMGYPVKGMLIGTFHSLCARILRQESRYTPYERNFSIYSSSEQRTLMKYVEDELNISSKTHPPAKILAQISNAKNNLIAPADYPEEDYTSKMVRQAYLGYAEELRTNNALDFDDLLMQTVILFRNHPRILQEYQQHYPYMLVDEFQDTNLAQYELVRMLAEAQRNIFVVGDPDQSIYAFRGANYENITRFQRDFPEHKIITLDQNYRSHQLILDAAMGVIRKNTGHVQRDLFSDRKKGPLIEIWEVPTSRDQGLYITEKIHNLRVEEGYGLRDFTIMYRTHSQTRHLEAAFRDANIPYQILAGVRFYERKEIKDLLSYLFVIENPNDTHRLMRILNVPPRGIGDKTQKILLEWIHSQDNRVWDVLYQIKNGNYGPLGARAGTLIAGFVMMLEDWMKIVAAGGVDILGLMNQVLDDTEYS
ncbi:MAG TPA: UvrD-helicase domain-containing protein, partial [Aggregatilineales bacterium]|nr:UvrD-helicase domain-containing protein [Aggregatilineales bacterium]